MFRLHIDMCTCSVYIVLYYLYIYTYIYIVHMQAPNMDEACFMSESLPELVCRFLQIDPNCINYIYICIYILQQYITSGLQTISRCRHCIVDPVSGIFPILPGCPVLPLNNREHHETTYRKKYLLTLLLVSRRIYVMCYVSCPASKAAPSHTCQECSFFVWRMQEKLGKIHQTFPK